MEALNRDQGNIDALYFTARAYNFLDHPKEALPLAEAAIDLAPNDARHVEEQVWALHLMGQSELARETAHQGLRRFRDDPGLLSFLEETK